jgi:hypothetical protein
LFQKGILHKESKMKKNYYWLLNKRREVIGLIMAKNCSEALNGINPKLKIMYACKVDFRFVPKVNYILFSSPFLFYDEKKKRRAR